MNYSLYDLACRAYCTMHRFAKRTLNAVQEPAVSFFYCYSPEDAERILSARRLWEDAGSPYVNDAPSFPSSSLELFWGENVLDMPGINLGNGRLEYIAEAKISDPDDLWRAFLNRSIVPEGWKNAGLNAVCFSRDLSEWMLSSWIWTSAAIARYHASVGDKVRLRQIADALLRMQLPEGGWVVRHDFINRTTTPMIAPNDSAYIACNSLLPAFLSFGEETYLLSAERCARWIIKTAKSDGMVYIGQNGLTKEWIADRNIVDTGFTAALFASLFEITRREDYRKFLSRFVRAYVDTFWCPEEGLFATAVDGQSRHKGGHFARGQAWALEGIIPAARVLESKELEAIAARVIQGLLRLQSHDGGWAYNLSHPLMGQDCKGIPVIARSLAEWGVSRGDGRACSAASTALDWCRAHTVLSGAGAGGIISFSLEGGVTHQLYSEAAFTYASSYALETAMLLNRESL